MLFYLVTSAGINDTDWRLVTSDQSASKDQIEYGCYARMSHMGVVNSSLNIQSSTVVPTLQYWESADVSRVPVLIRKLYNSSTLVVTE